MGCNTPEIKCKNTVHLETATFASIFRFALGLKGIDRHLQQLDKFPGLSIQKMRLLPVLALKRIFGAFRAQRTCLVAANVVLLRWGEANSDRLNPSAG